LRTKNYINYLGNIIIQTVGLGNIIMSQTVRPK
jgi:hypothetical protein